MARLRRGTRLLTAGRPRRRVVSLGVTAAVLLAALGLLIDAVVVQAGTPWPGRELGSFTFPSSGEGPTDVVSGPGGDLWTTDQWTGNISRVTTSGTVTDFSAGSGAVPVGIAVGSDGNLWFASGTDTIGKMTASGSLTSYTIPSDTGAYPNALAAGPSSALRFTEVGSSQIGTINTSGTVTSQVSVSGNPWDIVAGAGGTDYFTESGSSSKVGVINSSGSVTAYSLASGHSVFEGGGSMVFDSAIGTSGTVYFIDAGDNEIGAFNVSTHAITYTAAPSDASAIDGLTLTADGTIWFTETTSSGMVGELFPASGKIQEYPIKDAGSDVMDAITQGPDGNMWLLDQDANAIDEVASGSTTSSSFALTTPDAGPWDVVDGSDGNLWLTESYAGKIAKVTPTGTVSEYSTGIDDYGPYGLTVGSDGNVWYVDGADTIGTATSSGSVSNYTIPDDTGAWPDAIAQGSSGSLRFAEVGSSQIGTITTSGSVTSQASTDGNPQDIVAATNTSGAATGTDWFTDIDWSTSTSYIGEIDSSGAVTEFPLASGHTVAQAEGTMAFQQDRGTDGTVWFIDSGDNEIGAFDLATQDVTYYPAPSDASAIDGLTLASDGTIWFSETTSSGRVGELDPSSGRITEYPISGAGGDTMTAITQDAAGNFWVLSETANSIDELSITPVAAPVNTALPTITGTAKDGQTLTASTGSWTGTPPIGYAYQWESCNSSGASCTNISGATSSTYTLGHSDVGTTVRVVVTASNASTSTTPATSAQTAVVAAAAPVNTVLPAITGSAQQGQTVTASTGTWTGTPTITYTYKWEYCNSSGASCSTISSATSSTYTVPSTYVGDTLRVIVKGTNSTGNASATSSQTAVVVPPAPVNTVLPAISGTTTDGHTLSASNGTWTGSGTITYAYQWESCNSSGASCTNISGATNSTYVLGHGDVATTVRIVVTATNSGGPTPATSSQTAVIAAASPVNTTLPAISGTAQDEQTLSVSNGSWTGTPPLTYTYQWQLCNSTGGSCTNISGATSSTYAVTSSDVGDTLAANVTASNSPGNATAISAATSAVTAAPPVNTALPAITGTPQVGDTLTASNGTWTGTPSISYSYQWQDCNSSGTSCSNIAGATSSTYGVSSSDVGDTIDVAVTATNSAGSPVAASEPTATVVGDAPSGTLNTPSSSYLSGSVQVTGTASDPTSGVASWTVQILPSGSTSWQTGCSSSTPTSGSDYVCTLTTIGYIDGNYQLRAEITSTLGTTYDTDPISVVLDNTPPSGTLTQPSGIIDGTTTIQGSATDAISGIASWTLQIQGPGTSGWQNACPVQTTPSSGSTYGCNVDTTQYSDGTYQLQAIIADNAGNISTTSPVTTQIIQGWAAFAGNSSDCTDVWTGSGGDSEWTTAANWSTGNVPDSSDDACIPGTNTTVLINGSAQAATVSDQGTLEDQSGSLTLASSSPASLVVSLTESGGSLSGSGEVDVSGSFDWSGGEMSGSGSTVLLSGASGVIDGPSNGNSGYQPVIDARTLTNDGSLTLTSGLLWGGDGATLDNNGTLALNAEDQDANVSAYATGMQWNQAGVGELVPGPAPALINSGTIEKTAGSGITQENWPIDNENSVDAHSGQLDFTGGGTSGQLFSDSWSAASGASLAFDAGSFSLGSSSSLAGDIWIDGGDVTVDQVNASELQVTSGSLEIDGPDTSSIDSLSVSGTYTDPWGDFVTGSLVVNSPRVLPVGNLALSDPGGILSGSGEVDVSGSFDWSGGEMSGTGSTVLLDSSSGVIDGPPQGTSYLQPTMDARTLVNDGSLTFSSGLLWGGDGATLDNNGTLALNSEDQDANAGNTATGMQWDQADVGELVPGPAPALMNFGTIEKTAGSGLTQENWPIENESAINVASGQLDFTGGGTSGQLFRDSWSAATGASLAFGAGSFSLGSSSSLSGDGEIGIASADVSVDQVNASDVQVGGGSLEIDGPDASSIDSLSVSGTYTDPYGDFVTGSLVVDAKALTVGSLSLSDPGGILSGSGEVDVSGSFDWSGGEMSGTGSTVLLDSSSGVIDGPPQGTSYLQPTMDARTLVNEGSLTLSSGLLWGGDGATLDNTGTLTLNSEDQDANFSYPATGMQWDQPGIGEEVPGPAPALMNFGTIRKTAGTGTTEEGWPIDEQGTVDEQSGTIWFIGGQLPAVPIPADIRGGNAAAPNIPDCQFAGSVGCASGDMSESQTDLSVSGLGGGLTLTRSYDSQAADTAAAPGIFGYGWSGSYTDSLVIDSAAGTASVDQSDGTATPFTINADGSFSPAAAWVQAALVQNPDGSYTYRLPDRDTMTFNASGALVSEADQNGNATSLSYNGFGQLVGITDAGNQTVTLTYNTAGLVATATDPTGLTVSYGYDSNDNLVDVTDSSGLYAHRWQFAYDGSHEMTSMTDADGNTTTTAYDSSGRVISQTDPMGRITTWSYTGDPLTGPSTTQVTNPAGYLTDATFEYGEPTQMTNGAGTTHATTKATAYNASYEPVSDTNGNNNTTTYSYDSSGNQTSTNDADNDTTTDTYNAYHQITSETAPDGETTTMTYDGNGNLISESKPLVVGGTTTATATTSSSYNPDGTLASETNPDNHTTNYTYNSQGNLASETDPDGNTTTYTYDADGRQTSTTSPEGNVTGANPANYTTTYTLDALGSVTATTDPLGNVTRTGYDPDGNVVSSTDPNGNTTTTTYDADGEVTKTAYANGSSQLTTYTPAGQVATQTARSGGVTSYVYDAAGNLTSETNPLGTTTSYTYDAAGQKTSMTDPDGNTTSYTYDPAGQLTVTALPGGSTQKTSYTPDGQVATTTNQDGQVTSHTYDSLGRMTSETGPLDRTTSYTYDLDSNKTSMTDADGYTTSYTYDPAGQLSQTTYPDSSTQQTTYTPDGQVATQTDQEGNVTSYSYDADGNLTSETNPLGQTTSYTYDLDGNKTSVTDAEGRTTSYSYDDMNQVTAVSYSDGSTHDVTYTFNPDGTVASMTDGTGTSTYSYDQLDRRTATTDGAGASIDYGYDNDGNITSITYPNGKTVTRAFDAEGSLSSVTDWLGNTTTFNYDPDQNLTETIYAGSADQKDTYTYDDADEVTASATTANGSTVASIDDTYDPDGNLTQESSTGLGDSTQDYTYNSLDELTGDNGTSDTYDGDRNLTQLNGNSTPMTYNDADELTSGPGGTYSYNSLGERTGQTNGPTTTNYGWNQADDLTTNTGGPSDLDRSYAYDGNGLLQSTTDGSGTTQLTWDTNASLPLLIVDGTTNIIYGPNNLPLEQIGSDNMPIYYHHDQLGSTRLLTNAAGDPLETINYSPYGTATVTGGPLTNLLFAGQYTDPNTGLVYMRARWYDPATGQFMSVDPDETQTQAVYYYAADNPITGRDPSGLAAVASSAAEHEWYIWNYFSGTLSDIQTAALLGNLLQENSALSPTESQGCSGCGYGLAQWTLGASWNYAVPFAKEVSLPHTPITTLVKITNTFQFQVYFLASEILNPNWQFIAAKPALIPVFMADQHSSLSKATKDFEHAVEGAATPDMNTRLCYASSVYKSRGRSFQPRCPNLSQ